MKGKLSKIILLGYIIIYKKVMKGDKRLSKRLSALVAILACYLIVVLGATLERGGYYESEIHLYPFSSYKEAWNTFSIVEWRNIILNILTVILSINSNKAIDKTVENLDVSLSIVENNIEQIEKLNKLTKVKELNGSNDFEQFKQFEKEFEEKYKLTINQQLEKSKKIQEQLNKRKKKMRDLRYINFIIIIFAIICLVCEIANCIL